MAKIQGNGRPTQFTKGVKGDVYTDLNTGNRYECLGSDGFVGRGQSNELVKYDWLELREYGVISGGSSEGGVTSYNDLTDVPCKTVSTKFVGFENKVVEIFEETSEYNDYVYYSGLIEGALGELGTTTGSGWGCTCDFNVRQDDRYVIIVDGVEYQGKISVFANYIFAGTPQLVNSSGSMHNSGATAPIGIVATEKGFLIGMTEEFNGTTPDVSFYVYKDNVSKLDEKYIPDIYVKNKDYDNILKFVKWETYDTNPVITAGETVLNDQFTDYSAFGSNVIIVHGEYTDGDGTKHTIPLNWSKSGSLITITLNEAIEYDVYPVVYSIFQFCKYYPM